MKKVDMEMVLKIVSLGVKTPITEDQVDLDLSTVGMDSIVFIQIVVLIEEEFDCEIPDSKLLLSEMNTAKKIYNVLKSIEED